MRSTILHLSVIFFFALTLSVLGQTQNLAPINYTINCSYDPETRIIDGELEILWRKSIKPKIDELQFHLYLNAFSGPNSTFMQEYGEFPASVAERPGYCKIKQVEINHIDVTRSMKYIQPDDGNTHDSTVVSVPVPNLKRANIKQNSIIGCSFKNPEQIYCKIKFQSKLPALLERVGVYEDFIMAAQWFPQIGVFEEDGWKCHQFHANSEFYANFGTYNVTLTLPDNYVVGATGEMFQRKRLPNNLQQLQFKASKVHDFAWCADATMNELVGTTNINRRKKYVRLLYQPEHEGEVAKRIMQATLSGIEYYQFCYGEYPYSQITVIDAPIFNAVMEYPTLFLTGNFDGYKNPPAPAEPYPDNNRFLERLTLHELGHQWFYGVCANNEAEEAWLDEGLTEYITAKAFENRYGNIMQLDENGKPLRVRDFRKDRYLANPNVLPSTSKSWEFPTFGDYYIASYVKPKLLFYTLDNVLGEEKMHRIIKAFYQRFAFRHPKAEDFFKVVEEVAGKETRNQVVHFLSSSITYDVGVNSDWKSVQVFGNLYDYPIEHQLQLPNNYDLKVGDNLNLVNYPTIRNKRYDGMPVKHNTFLSKFKQTKKVQPTGYFISLDPDSLIEFDINRSNNFLKIEPDENY